MKTLLSDSFELQEVTQDDLTIASLCWGYDRSVQHLIRDQDLTQ